MAQVIDQFSIGERCHHRAARVRFTMAQTTDPFSIGERLHPQAARSRLTMAQETDPLTIGDRARSSYDGPTHHGPNDRPA